jgi:hypothetical protein
MTAHARPLRGRGTRRGLPEERLELRHLLDELDRHAVGKRSLTVSPTSSFALPETKMPPALASSRALLKFEGGGSTGPDRKIGVLTPKGTADEGQCQEDGAPPRGDGPARVRCDVGRASDAA